MNKKITDHFAKLKFSALAFPILLLVVVFVFLERHNALNPLGYVNIQKDCFYLINSKLSQYPTLIYNLTQLGDAMILLSFLSILVLYVPKTWEAFISASLFSLFFSKFFKSLFSVPRPAQILDQESFTIVGKTLVGHSSLPSGHSITIFTLLTVLIIAFMPKKFFYKVLWILCLVAFGLLVAFTRVGVGAHFPLDVIIGSIFGCISGMLGIFLINRVKVLNWIANKKYYPIFILAFIVCSVVLVIKIREENLIVFYLALASLLISLYSISTTYLQYRRQQ